MMSFELLDSELLDSEFEQAPETERSPRPDLATGIEPLGPTLARIALPAGRWESFVLSLDPQAAEAAAPPRYKVEFITGDEYVRLVDRAKEQLCRTLPEAGIDEIQLRALRAYVAELEGAYTRGGAAM